MSIVAPETLPTGVYSPDFNEFEAATSQLLPELARQTLQQLKPEQIALNNKWHPSGAFMVHQVINQEIGFTGEPSGVQLRVHFWPSPTMYISRPHQHPWHMGVLQFGTSLEYRPKVGLDTLGNANLRRVQYPTGEDTRAIVEDIGLATAEYGRPLRYVSGLYHSLPAGEYHASNSPTNPYISVTLMGPRQVDSSYFLEYPNEPTPKLLGNLSLADLKQFWGAVQVAKTRSKH